MLFAHGDIITDSEAYSCVLGLVTVRQSFCCELYIIVCIFIVCTYVKKMRVTSCWE